MELIIKGKSPVVISSLREDKRKRIHDTPYTNEFLKGNVDSDFKFRLTAYSNIHKVISGEYNTYLDLLGGVGLTGRIFKEVGVQCVFNDLNLECREILKANNPASLVTAQDMFDYEFIHGIPDVTLVDFNDFTLKKYQEKYKKVLDNVFRNTRKYVVVNDCSVFYLKMGKKSYEVYSRLLGFEVGSKKEFLEGTYEYYKREYPEWRISHIETFTNSSIVLFEKISFFEPFVKINNLTEFTDLLTIKL